MKKSILSLVIALIAVFSVSSAIAQNSKWTKDPCSTSTKTSVTITGMATGLGSGQYFAHITGQYDCVNNGTQTPGAAKWSNIDVTVPLQSKPSGTGGNLKLTAVLQSLCDHANWTFLTQNLQVTVVDANDNTVIGATAVNACQ